MFKIQIWKQSCAKMIELYALGLLLLEQGNFHPNHSLWKTQLKTDTNFSKTHLSFLSMYINEQHSPIWTLSLTDHFISYHATKLWKYFPCPCSAWNVGSDQVGLYMRAHMDGTLPMHWPVWRDESLDLEAITEFSWCQSYPERAGTIWM